MKFNVAMVWGLCSFAALTGAWAEEENISDRCALCHEEATKQWAESPHARSMGNGFLPTWEREGKKMECLVCHTTRFDRQAGTFSHEGVTCESCHGTISEKHPDGDKKTLPVTSETCQACHTITYGEWRISAHGQKNIRCFDCHKMHSMTPRKANPDEMCGTCHTAKLEDFSHATHAQEGLHCVTCHMPELGMGGPKIKGTGVRGHTFGVGAETCTKCHAEMVHRSSGRAELEKEVKELKAAEPVQLGQQVAELRTESEQLRDKLAANHRIFAPVVAVAFALGLVIGYAVPHVNRKHREGK